MKYESIIRAFCNTPLAMDPRAWGELEATIALHLAGIDTRPEAAKPIRNVKGDVAVIPIYGMIFPHSGFMSKIFGTSSEDIISMTNEVKADASVGAALYRVRSGGGAVAMSKEAADAIASLSKVKHTIGIADHMAASAAMWMMSQVNEKVITPSGEIGSIGVIAKHYDESKAMEAEGVKLTLITSSKYKAEGASNAPLTDEAYAEIQKQVNEKHAIFVDDVARGYGITPAAVEKNFGQGRMFGAKEAKDRGMVTRIETFNETLARLTGAKAAADLSRRRMAV